MMMHTCEDFKMGENVFVESEDSTIMEGIVIGFSDNDMVQIELEDGSEEYYYPEDIFKYED